MAQYTHPSEIYPSALKIPSTDDAKFLPSTCSQISSTEFR